MRRAQRILLLVTLIAAAPAITGCADFDMDKLDVFHLNDKKKLPGERKEVFPGGVPGVTQGIPKEYMKGNVEEQPGAATPLPTADAAANPQQQAAAPAAEAKTEPKAKPKPKPKRVVRRAVKPKPAVAAQPQPAAEQPPPPQEAQTPAPWPTSPPPGTFQR